MPPASIRPWRIERQGTDAILGLSGNWLVREAGLHILNDLPQVVDEAGNCARLCFEASSLAHWDSALVIFVRALQTPANSTRHRFAVDVAGLPEPLQRLLTLAKVDPGGGSPLATRCPNLHWSRVPGPGCAPTGPSLSRPLS